jgi:hypothetical protein
MLRRSLISLHLVSLVNPMQAMAQVFHELKNQRWALHASMGVP